MGCGCGAVWVWEGVSSMGVVAFSGRNVWYTVRAHISVCYDGGLCVYILC